MCSLKCLVLSVVISINLIVTEISGNPFNATIDQRQTGKYNVQLNIKDVTILVNSDNVSAEFGDDVSYDYDYDYDHLTIKPSPAFTNKPPITVSLNETTIQPKPTEDATTFSPTTSHKPTQSVIILEESKPPATTVQIVELPTPTKIPTTTSTISPTSADNSLFNSTIYNYPWNGNIQEIPVHVIMEPLLKVKNRTHAAQYRRFQTRRQQNEEGKHPRLQRHRRRENIGLQNLFDRLFFKTRERKNT